MNQHPEGAAEAEEPSFRSKRIRLADPDLKVICKRGGGGGNEDDTNTPRAIQVTGAGNPLVNGLYTKEHRDDDFIIYTKIGEFRGARKKFAVCRRKFAGRTDGSQGFWQIYVVEEVVFYRALIDDSCKESPPCESEKWAKIRSDRQDEDDPGPTLTLIRGNTIDCHSMIMAGHSLYFDNLLSGSMKESISKEVTLDDVAPETFELAMSYLEDPSRATVVGAAEIMEVAPFYDRFQFR
jgi:hypothetical protein